MIKTKFLIIVLTFTCLFTNVTDCKAQTFPWAKTAVGTGNYDESYSICLDINGNVFITGTFQSPILSFGTNTIAGVGSVGTMFLAKYDSNGNPLWARGVGGGSGEGGHSVSSDANGNVFVAGYFISPTINFGSYTLTNAGSFDGFIVKYDPSGNVLWAKNASGINYDYVYSVSVDPSGNAFIAGGFSSPILSFGTTTLTNSGGSDAVFVAKYSPNGTLLWAKSIGGFGDRAYSINSDPSGNALVTGYFSGSSITFGTTTLINSSTGGYADIFITKYDVNGNSIWAKSSGGIYNDYGHSICSDASGNVFITGEFQSPNLALGTYSFANAGMSDIFVAKYDSNGNVIWANSAGGIKLDKGFCISTYAGGVFVTGGFDSPPFAFGTTTVTPPYNSLDAMFIVNYDLNGNVICAEALSSGGDDESGVCADQFGNAYITGDFMANPFVVGTTTISLTAPEQIFLTKFSCGPLNVNNINENLILRIFPNPNNGSFKFQIDNEIHNGELILYNSLGQKVHQQKIVKGENNIITNNLSKGLYHYTLSENKQVIHSGKMVIE